VFLALQLSDACSAFFLFHRPSCDAIDFRLCQESASPVADFDCCNGHDVAEDVRISEACERPVGAPTGSGMREIGSDTSRMLGPDLLCLADVLAQSPQAFGRPAALRQTTSLIRVF
jgi:hypothetical protein